MSRRIERHDVTVTTTAAVVMRIDCTNLEWVFLYVKNNGGSNALNSFSVSRGVLDDVISERFVVANDATEFADQSRIGCVGTDGAGANPVTLAANTAVALQIATFGCDYIEISASTGSGTTDLRFAGRGF